MKQTITIRAAKAEDAELLAKLGRETFDEAFAGNPLMPQDDLRLYLDSAFTVSQIVSELNEPKTILFLAEIDGEPAGYARLDRGLTTEGVTGKNPIKLKRLYARQKFIGFGVGAALMKCCLEEAQRLGHDTIWLTVWEHNLQAQKFYEKWEFKPCARFDFSLGNTVLTDSVMQRQVRNITIITPTSEKEVENARQLGYQYVAAISEHPIVRGYAESLNFYEEIDHMPKGYKEPDGAYLLALVDDEPAGIVALRKLEQDICEMKRLFVAAKFQGLGLGRILTERIIDEGKRLGYSRMRLDSFQAVMGKAVTLYKTMGFYEIEPYHQHKIPDVFLEKILSD